MSEATGGAKPACAGGDASAGTASGCAAADTASLASIYANVHTAWPDVRVELDDDGSSSAGTRSKRLVAATALPPGRVVLRTLPSVCVPLALVTAKPISPGDPTVEATCCGCLRLASGCGPLTRCTKCKRALYCSRECQLADWKAHHKRECRFFAAAASAGPKTPGKRTSSTSSVWLQQLTDRQRQAMLVLGRLVGLLHSHPDLPPQPSPSPCPPSSMALAASPAQLAGMWAPRAATPDAEMAAVETFFRQHAELLLPSTVAVPPSPAVQQLLRQMAANNFTLTTPRQQRLVATGVYPLGALLNHACQPSCIVRYGDGGEQIFQTVRAVAAGEQLTHAYVDAADYASPAARRAALESSHGFTCACQRCAREEEEEGVEGGEEDRTRDGPLPLPKALPKGSEREAGELERAMQQAFAQTGDDDEAELRQLRPIAERLEALSQGGRCLCPPRLVCLRLLMLNCLQRGALDEAAAYAAAHLRGLLAVYRQPHPRLILPLTTLLAVAPGPAARASALQLYLQLSGGGEDEDDESSSGPSSDPSSDPSPAALAEATAQLFII